MLKNSIDDAEKIDTGKIDTGKIKEYKFKAEEKDNGKRLDLFIKEKLSATVKPPPKKLSRNYIQKSTIKVNTKLAKKNYRIQQDDEIEIFYATPPENELNLNDLAERNTEGEGESSFNRYYIVYEDEYLLVINKSMGLVVHPAAGNYSGTMVQLLADKLKEGFDLSKEERPGIVHRLDKDTSGLMVIAKTKEIEERLKASFSKREIEKIYKSLVKGELSGEGRFAGAIKRDKTRRKVFRVEGGGREALTLYKSIKTYRNGKRMYTLVELKPITGRTHQIRVHLSNAGHPIVGDKLYSRANGEFDKEGLLLCATGLKFKHPNGFGAELSFKIDFPKHMQERIDYLETIHNIYKE